MQTGGITSEVGRDQFLQLLVTQLRNQDPLQPVKDEAFIAQLAQFSTLEGVENLNASFSDLLSLQQLTQGTNLLGQLVVYEDAGSGGIVRGTVQGVVADNGKLFLLVDGNQVALEHIRGLADPQSLGAV